MLGEAEIVVTGGTESMSQAPYAVRNTRWGTTLGTDLKVGCMMSSISRDDIMATDDCSGGFSEMWMVGEKMWKTARDSERKW